jgi:hypothetical protein
VNDSLFVCVCVCVCVLGGGVWVRGCQHILVSTHSGSCCTAPHHHTSHVQDGHKQDALDLISGAFKVCDLMCGV